MKAKSEKLKTGENSTPFISQLSDLSFPFGWLSAIQRYEARCKMVRAAGRKVRAERAMKENVSC